MSNMFDWASELSANDFREFLHDIVAAANFGLLSGSLERLEAAVSEWRETAHVLRDPELRERLLTPILDLEFEDAPRPEPTGHCICDRFREVVAREYGEITDLEGLIAPGCVAHH